MRLEKVRITDPELSDIGSARCYLAEVAHKAVDGDSQFTARPSALSSLGHSMAESIAAAPLLLPGAAAFFRQTAAGVDSSHPSFPLPRSGARRRADLKP